MSEPRSDPTAGFDEIADRLYALTPDAFAAARDEAVKQARAAKDAALAKELAALRRPTQSAWIVNLLWRDQAPVLEQLFQIADGLSLAQAQSAGAQFRELLALRRQLESALLRQAEALAIAHGVRPTAATMREVQETLSSALTSREVADEVRSGRLVKPPGPIVAGFGGPVAPIAPAAAPRPVEKIVPIEERRAAVERERAEREEQAQAERERVRAETEAQQRARAEEEARRAEEEARRAEEEARRQAEEQRRREEAERRRQEARASVAAADALLAEESAAHEAAAARSAELRGRLDRLREQLRDAEADARSAEDALAAAARRREHAAKAYEAAVRLLASLD